MCGILGYIGKGRAYGELLQGLARLEYRGYDSCGIAAMYKGKLLLKKRSGKITQLKNDLRKDLNVKTDLAILHTRWATHGRPNTVNAHPHYNAKKTIAVVHNGIIENFLALKEELIGCGCHFRSETDSEVIAHLIEQYYSSSLYGAVQKAAQRLQGSFALAVVCSEEPDTLVAVRKASPLIIGVGSGEYFVASDMPAILPFTHRVIYLQDDDVVLITPQTVSVHGLNGHLRRPRVETVTMKAEEAEKKGFEHFMLKEIHEQPAVLSKILSAYTHKGNINFPQLNISEDFLRTIKKINLVACGTAYHAGFVAKYFLEQHCDIDVDIDTSSEFRYRNVHIEKDSLFIAISQSGETADTLAAVRQAKTHGAKILCLCNVLGSSLVKESDGLIATLAGPEIGVASTKAYTAQVLCLYIFALQLARIRKTMSCAEQKTLLEALYELPRLVEAVLEHTQRIRHIARTFSKFGSFLFLGRGINFPTALEGALKLKEISYIPAEGYAAGEMKHGPIALIDEYRGVVCIAPYDNLHEKMFSNIQEARARKGKILAILSEGDEQASLLSHRTICIPKVQCSELNPILSAVCLQLFAYFVAKNLGCEIDQPRNLAKSVTVE